MKHLYPFFRGYVIAALLLTGLFTPTCGIRAQPSITASRPVANTSSAARTSPITVSFSQPLTAASAAALKVYSAQRGGLRSRGATPAVVSGSSLQYSPLNYPYMPGETVYATVTAAAASSTGNLASGQVMQFTAAVTGVGRRYFASGTDMLVGGRAASVALGDVDGDGDLDLVAALTETISVRLNGGDASGSNTGSFGDNNSLYVGGEPYGIALGDVDGDGDLDVVATNKDSNVVHVRLNGGDASGSSTGIFSNGSNVSLGGNTSPRGLALGDVDGDGDLDVLTANSGTNTVSVCLNGGNGLGSNTGIFSIGATVAVGR